MLTERIRKLFEKVFNQTANGVMRISTDVSYSFNSVPVTLIGEQTATQVLAPDSGNRLVIKGLTLTISGAFNAYLKRSSDGEVILPIYGSKENKASGSSSLNIQLEVDETLYVDTDGAAVDDETFVGITYIQVS